MAQIDNHLTARKRHTHPDGELMADDELRAHMIKYHAWSVSMMMRRGNYDEGDYLRRWHTREHLPGQWPGSEPVPEGF